MTSRQPSHPESFHTVALQERLEIFARINHRREQIRQRWEKLGIHVDPAELIRETREEEP